jgi:hypothetical protein
MQHERATQEKDDELEKIFPKKVAPPKLPLPIDFDDTCKNRSCEIRMERVQCHYCVEPAPFETFQCPKCLLRLYLFDAPNTPFLMWSDTVRKSGQTFSEQVQALIKKREEHWQISKRRHGEAE